MSKEAVQLVEQFFSGIAGGSIDDTLAVMAEDVEWTPTIWSGSGTYWGVEEMRIWLSQYGENLEWLRIEVGAVLSSNGGAFAQGVIHDSREGRAYAAVRAWFFEAEDGAIVRGQAFVDVGEARSAAGLPPVD